MSALDRMLARMTVRQRRLTLRFLRFGEWLLTDVWAGVLTIAVSFMVLRYTRRWRGRR